MAEFLAIAGGMAAVVQLAGTGRRFSKTLHRFATTAGAAAAKGERFANQVRTFSAAVEVAKQTLFSYCPVYPKSPLVAYIGRCKILASIDNETRAVRAHLRAIQARVVNMESRSVLWASFKWTMNKSSILELSPEMESVKSNLGLLISTTHFAAFMRTFEARMQSGSEEENKQLKKQLRRLRRVIKHHLKTRQDLRPQLDHIRHAEREASFDSLDYDLTGEDPLTALGWSLYERGTIPSSPDTSPSSSVRNHSSRPRDTRRTSPKPRRPSRLRSPQQASPELLDSPPSTGATIGFETSSDPPLLTNKILRYGQKDVIGMTSGYITNPNNDLRGKQTTATLVQSLEGNIISIPRARELNLDIQLPSLSETVAFDFGTGRPEKSFGKTTFKWKAWDHIDPRYLPLTITCDVCENSMVGLILGQPFFDERERCWPREGERDFVY